MVVTIKQKGGYAGTEIVVFHVDTDALPQAQAEYTKELVEKSHFFSLLTDNTEGEIGADMLEFQITVKDGERVHSISVIGENRSAGPVAQLLDDLMRSAKVNH